MRKTATRIRGRQGVPAALVYQLTAVALIEPGDLGLRRNPRAEMSDVGVQALIRVRFLSFVSSSSPRGVYTEDARSPRYRGYGLDNGKVPAFNTVALDHAGSLPTLFTIFALERA